MSALANGGWESRSSAAVAQMPIPEAAEESALSNRIRIIRDTILVVGIQIVFRATMVLRRWNY
ncbi:MAG: hypothetical protein WB780_14030 [Candidatus Acidiferrales bacterium]